MHNMEFYYKNGETMDIGFIGFGKVSQTLTKQLKKQHKIYTSIEGRSEKTIQQAQKSQINILKTNQELQNTCELLINATSPENALKTAKTYKNYKGLYLDLNNINPKTTQTIGTIFNKNFINGAIIGKVTNLTLILLSGPKANQLKFLNENNIPTQVISNQIEDASTLKMLRSIYTKGLSSLLIETFDNAENLKLTKQLWNILEITENEDFKKSSISRIKNSKKSAKRKNEELNEILNFLNEKNASEYNQIMTHATKNKFKEL